MAALRTKVVVPYSKHTLRLLLDDYQVPTLLLTLRVIQITPKLTDHPIPKTATKKFKEHLTKKAKPK